MKKRKSIAYTDGGLHGCLKNPAYAAEYVNAHFAEDDEDRV